MNTKINLTYKDNTYTLEYNRMSVKRIESDGFELDKFASQPMSMIELAFKGSFLKNHSNIKPYIVDEIYNHCENKEKLIEMITTMISECYTSLMESPKDGEEGNATWEVVDLSPKMSQE